MGRVELAKLGERLYWRCRAQRTEPLVEIALHAVFENHRAVRVLALGVFEAGTGAPLQQIILWIGRNDAGDVRGIDNHRALLFQRRDRFVHYFILIGIQALARFCFAGSRDGIVVEGAGNSDACSLEAVALQKFPVVTVRRRSAFLRRRIVRIGRGALENAQQNGRVGDLLRFL